MRGWNDNSQNGPGSGHYWLDQYLLLGSSPASFINRALNSDFGGSWNNGHGYLFTSSGQAFAAGAAYNFEHDSWGHTYCGDYEASLVGYVALRATGELLSPDAVHTAIKLVRNGVRSFGPAVTCNEPNCTHHMMGPRVEYTQGNGSSGLSTPFVAATTFSATAAAARSTLNVVNQELAKQNLINNMLKKSDLQRTAFSGIKAPGAVKFVGKFGGAGFAVWGAADIDAQYRAGGMSRGQMYVEQISNGIGAIPYMGIGTAWSIGWTLGGQYGPSKWYGSDDTKWFR